MKLSDFQKSIHKTSGKVYAASSYNLKSFWGSPAMREFARHHTSVDFLELGCGQGQFIKDFCETSPIKKLTLHGVDIEDQQLTPEVSFRQFNIDEDDLPFADRQFDLIASNHVLEHCLNTEHVLREARRVLKPDGVAVIQVPNVGCWESRLSLLFGGAPLWTECGVEGTSYGVRPRFLQRRQAAYPAMGHVRVFTPRALRDLSEHCGFAFTGWWKPGVTKKYAFTPATLCQAIGIFLRPR